MYLAKELIENNSKIQFNGNLFIIKHRKEGTIEKPRYYLWNNAEKKAPSSLYKIKGKQEFLVKFKREGKEWYIIAAADEGKFLIRKKDKKYETENYW